MRFSVLFGLIGSIAGTSAIYAIFYNSRVGIREAIIGTIVGGVTNGAAATYLNNIGISIMIGSAGAFLSILVSNPIHRLINKNYMFDALGLFGPLLVSALLGSVVVPAGVLAYYSSKGYENQGISSAYTSDKIWTGIPASLPSYQLIYAGLSAACGGVGGILSGLACRWDKDKFAMLSNSRIF